MIFQSCIIAFHGTPSSPSKLEITIYSSESQGEGIRQTARAEGASPIAQLQQRRIGGSKERRSERIGSSVVTSSPYRGWESYRNFTIRRNRIEVEKRITAAERFRAER